MIFGIRSTQLTCRRFEGPRRWCDVLDSEIDNSLTAVMRRMRVGAKEQVRTRVCFETRCAEVVSEDILFRQLAEYLDGVIPRAVQVFRYCVLIGSSYPLWRGDKTKGREVGYVRSGKMNQLLTE